MSEEQQKPVYKAENEDAEADSIFGSTLEKTEPPANTGGLSRNARWLIIGGCALIVLGGCMTAVILSDKGDSGETDSALVDSLGEEETQTIALNPRETNDVTQIRVHNDKGDFTVRRTALSQDGGKPTYMIDGYEDLTLNNDLLWTLPNNGSGIEANSLVEESPDDLGKYGLGDTAAEVELDYEDGSTFSLRIGDASPTDTTQTYCLYDGDVYFIRSSLLNNYRNAAELFISSTVLAEPSDADYPLVLSLLVERKDLDYDILVEYAGDESAGTAASHVLREPVFAYLNLEHSTDVTNGMFGLLSKEVTAVHPTEKDLAAAGLDDPFCTVTMVCDDGNTYTLLIGDSYEAADGTACYYTCLNDTINGDARLIYGVKAENDEWATVIPNDFVSSNVIGTYVWDLKDLEITARDITLDFDCTTEKDPDDDDFKAENDFIAKKDGVQVDTERFRLLYRFLLSIYGEELYVGELPEGEPAAQVHLATQKGDVDVTYSFYQQSDMRTIIAIDGMPTYVVRTSVIDAMAHNLEIFDDTEQEFQTSWQ